MATPSYDEDDLLPQNDMTISTGGAAFLPFAPVEVAYALGQVYLFQRGNNIRVFDGSEVKIASGTAPGTFSATAITASVSGFTGTPYYTVVYYDPEQPEYCVTGPYADLSDPYLFPRVSAAAQDALLVISDPPAGEPRLTMARVYRSLNESADMCQLTGIGTYSDVTVSPGSNGTHAFTDTGLVADAELSTRDRLNYLKRYFDEGLPPKSWTGEFFKGRLWIVNADSPNVANFSEPNLPEDFPTENRVTILPSQGDPNPEIVAIRANNGQLWIYTQQGGYLVLGDSLPFTIRGFFRGTGSVSTSGTLYVEGAGVIFPAEDAFYLHTGGSEVARAGTPRKFYGMNPLSDLYEQMNDGVMSDMVGMIDTERSVITLAGPLEDGDPVNTGAFELDYVFQNWSRITRRVQTAMGRFTDVSGRLSPVFLDEVGGVWQSEIGNSEGNYGGIYETTSGAPVDYINIVLPGVIPADTFEVGTPITIYDQTTGAIVTRGRFGSGNTTNTIRLLEPMTALPAEGDIVEIGTIEAAWESGWMSVIQNNSVFEITYLNTYLQAQAGGVFDLLCGVDQNETLRSVATDIPTTEHMDRLAFNDRGSDIKVRMEAFAPGTDFALMAVDVEGIVKPYVR